MNKKIILAKFNLFKNIVDNINKELTTAQIMIFSGLLCDKELRKYILTTKNIKHKYKRSFLNQKLKVKEMSCKMIKKY